MRTLVVVLTTWILSGCTAMMVGGGTGGGYEGAKDERSATVVASDSAITTKIKGKYAADSVVSVFSIGVRTWEGIVTLSGTVGSYNARDQAEAIAKSTGGVKAVNNLIAIEDKTAK
ncbi:MAG: BON domain-containing protein [Woeseiaceae bacterium]